MIIEFGSNYRIRSYDPRNWVLEQYRTPTKNNRAKTDEAKWFSCDKYFQSLTSALKYVYNHELLEAEGQYTLKEALEKAQEIEKTLEQVEVK